MSAVIERFQIALGKREGNTLSSVLRQAWDGETLDTLTKNDPVTAMLAGADHIGVEHLRAALALWDYCERSARWIFGTATGNREADSILPALAHAGPLGLTTTGINLRVFQRNAKPGVVDAALDLLARAGLAVCLVEQITAGRPPRRWYAAEHAPNATSQARQRTTKETKEPQAARGLIRLIRSAILRRNGSR